MSARWTILALVSSLCLSCCCLLPFLSRPRPLEVGVAAPELVLASLEGETVSLADYAVRPVLLSFWSPY